LPERVNTLTEKVNTLKSRFEHPRCNSIIAVVGFHNRTVSLIETVRFLFARKSPDFKRFTGFEPYRRAASESFPERLFSFLALFRAPAYGQALNLRVIVKSQRQTLKVNTPTQSGGTEGDQSSVPLFFYALLNFAPMALAFWSR